MNMRSFRESITTRYFRAIP